MTREEMLLVVKCITDEEEFDGEMPKKMFDAIRKDKDAAAEALRISVRLTKQGILKRLSDVFGEPHRPDIRAALKENRQ